MTMRAGASEGAELTKNIEGNSAQAAFPSYALQSDSGESSLFAFLHAALFDTSLLAGKIAEVVELGAAHLAILVDCDRLNKGRLDGEDSLNADTVGNLANSETLLVFVAVDTDHDTAILLNSLLVTLLDAVGNSDSVTGTELVEILLGSSESLLCDFD